MKYSQDSKNEFFSSDKSRARFQESVPTSEQCCSKKSRKFADTAYKILSADLLAFLKPKKDKITKKQRLIESSTAPVSYISTSTKASFGSTEFLKPNIAKVSENPVANVSKHFEKSNLSLDNEESCNVLEVIKLSSELAKRNFPDRNIRIVNHTDRKIEIGISAYKLKQIMLFLFDDGFVRQQPVKAEISVSVKISEDNCFISISDHGNSVPSRVITKLETAKMHFGKIVQLRQNDGLTIDNYLAVLNTVMKVGGMLEVKSANNVFNLCLITLPLTNSQDKENNSPSLREFQTNESTEHKTELPSLSKDFLISEPNSDFVKNFDQILEKNYQNPNFKRHAAADLMSMSEKTLSRRLSYYYGSNFNLIVRQYRLNTAYKMIISGDFVSSAAYSVGFNSASYFTQCFKNKFGFAPSLLVRNKG